MAKRVGSQSDQPFIKHFRELTHRFSPWEVWKDFVVMFACALSNPVDKSHYEEREALYLKTIQKYNKQEQAIFPQLAAETVMALEENPEQDFLGNIFMNLGLGNDAGGQFFTPYHVCELMAKISIGELIPQVEEHGYITIVVAQDIDYTTALMCYIQLSLLGAAAYIKIGNSLTEPMRSNDTLENYWFTPMYFSSVWTVRRLFKGKTLL